MKIKSFIIAPKGEQDAFELVEICRKESFYKSNDLRNKDRLFLFVECYDIENDVWRELESKTVDVILETEDERCCFAAKNSKLRVVQTPRQLSSPYCVCLIVVSCLKSNICDFNEMKEKLKKKNQQNQQQ